MLLTSAPSFWDAKNTRCKPRGILLLTVISFFVFLR
jgi:hypothetical protein